MHPLLREKKNQFIFNVTDESGELEVKPELTKDSCLFTEYSKCKLKIKNLSLNFPLKNCYLLCSHPLLFGLEKQLVFDSLAQEECMEVELRMRACLFGAN